LRATSGVVFLEWVVWARVKEWRPLPLSFPALCPYTHALDGKKNPICYLEQSIITPKDILIFSRVERREVLCPRGHCGTKGRRSLPVRVEHACQSELSIKFFNKRHPRAHFRCERSELYNHLNSNIPKNRAIKKDHNRP
jgi:hypothetical protein